MTIEHILVYRAIPIASKYSAKKIANDMVHTNGIENI